MRFHGLVSLAVLGLSLRGLAQDNSVSVPPNLFPPAVRQPESGSGEPQPRALVATETDTALNIEAELRQFRTELREFQALREDVARNTQATDRDNDRVSLQQRKDLLEILTRLAQKGVGRQVKALPPAPAPVPELATQSIPPESISTQPREIDVEVTDDIADPFALGKVLFRSGDFIRAEKSFRKVPVTSENASTLNYLIATCLRRQLKWQPAVDVYKAVAESDQDPVLRDLAKWQLDNIQWHRQSEAQLEQMRREREKQFEATKSPPSKPGPPKSASMKRTIR